MLTLYIFDKNSPDKILETVDSYNCVTWMLITVIHTQTHLAI